ncbi:MAG TPA: hypothetical protein VER32_03615 [Pyrinomonadaceae bacterium]|nr:hypothetical protein [Pyrinomonadaceae bacterium]
MPTDERIFKSSADAQGLVTQLAIDPGKATITSIKLLRGSRAWLTLTASPISLFTVRFTKYSLVDNAYVLTRDEKKLTVEYKVGAPARYRPEEEDGRLSLKYPAVPPSRSGFSNIVVTVTLTRPTELDSDAGWIDLDISYSYPTQCVSGDNRTAWEAELIYPEMCFTNTRLSDFDLLDPVGLLGDFVRMSAEERVNLMPLQFAAFYKPVDTSDGFKHLRGVALSATDEQGHAKSLRYRPVRVGSAAGRAVSFHLTTPIHLRRNAYRRPAGSYTLSGGGDDAGFSGAQMHYRIRAFDVRGVSAGAPVDWHDVADIYRRWLDERRPSFYSKYISRYPNGFTYAMNPLTVISNYGLDGQVEPQATDLCKWLELHPVLVDGRADMPGNHAGESGRNESLQELLVRLKGRFGAVPGMRLEAQIWGFEMEGFYQALGAYPPATDVISGAGRFRRAMSELSGVGIVPSATTDPLNTNFIRSRYRGHLIKDGDVWRRAITGPFPAAIQTAAAAAGVATQETGNNRLFFALNSADASATDSTAAERGSQKLDGFGNRHERFEGLTRFYNIYGRRLCPTPRVQDFYVNTCLKARLFAHGFRHVEFMKHNSAFYFCYDKRPRHKHLEGQTAAADFDNVIGQGPWYVKRLQQILKAAQDAGQHLAGDDFALVNEFAFPETLVPYFDEYYEYESSSINVYYRDVGSLWQRRVQVFWYVYSPLVSMKMNLADTGPYVHPGYREQARADDIPAPEYMLAAERDDDGDTVDYYTWRHQCRLYNDPNFVIASSGLAPSAYPCNTQTGQNFTLYTYRRCVEEVFNLRSNVFRYGTAAVLGERIYLFVKLLEGFTEYTDEVINMAVRAAHMQMKFAQFFRGGRMLGQTRINTGNARLWAWRAHNRQFSDVDPLVRDLYTRAEINGTRKQPPVALSILDFISRGVDKLNVVPHGNYDYVPTREPDTLAGASRVTADRIQHMVWRAATGATLYAFANVGNSAQSVEFLCGRGLEGTAHWRRTDYTFAGDPGGSPAPRDPVAFEQLTSVPVPERACVGVLFEP